MAPDITDRATQLCRMYTGWPALAIVLDELDLTNAGVSVLMGQDEQIHIVLRTNGENTNPDDVLSILNAKAPYLRAHLPTVLTPNTVRFHRGDPSDNEIVMVVTLHGVDSSAPPETGDAEPAANDQQIAPNLRKLQPLTPDYVFDQIRRRYWGRWVATNPTLQRFDMEVTDVSTINPGELLVLLRSRSSSHPIADLFSSHDDVIVENTPTGYENWTMHFHPIHRGPDGIGTDTEECAMIVTDDGVEPSCDEGDVIDLRTDDTPHTRHLPYRWTQTPMELARWTLARWPVRPSSWSPRIFTDMGRRSSSLPHDIRRYLHKSD